MKADGGRSVRVAERLREELSLLIGRRVKDPRVEGVVVTRVQLTPDLTFARIYIRLFDETRKTEALQGLARAAGLLRKEVTARLRLRVAPDLRFQYDDGQDAELRVEAILHEIRNEKPS